MTWFATVYFTLKLQDFTNEVMVNHNFIIRLNGTKCKILILVIFSGGKKSAVVSMMQVAVYM